MSDFIVDEAALYQAVEEIQNATYVLSQICERYNNVLAKFQQPDGGGYYSASFSEAIDGYCVELKAIKDCLEEVAAPLNRMCASHISELDDIDKFLY